MCTNRATRLPASAHTVAVRERYDVAGGLAGSYLFEALTTEELEPLLAESRFRTAAQRLATSAAAVGNGELATDLVQALADAVTASR